MNETRIATFRDDANKWFASGRLSDAAAFALLGAFALVVAAFGGSSRPDPVQMALLRPLAALFLIPALYLLDARSLREGLPLLALLGAFVIWMGLQLVPLPPSVWQELPDRAIIAELDQLIGLGDQWRAISLAPARGMNAFLSLVVPAAALLLVLGCRANSQIIFHIVIWVGVVNAALGFVQVATGPDSPLYMYMYVAPRSAAGLFANENHSAVFSVIVLLVIARLSAEGHVVRRSGVAWTRIAYPFAFVIILLTVLVTGSRAGLACLAIALSAIGFMTLRATILHSQGYEGAAQSRVGIWQGSAAVPVVCAGLVVGLLALFFLHERTPALQDILEKSAFEDLRWQILPLAKAMAANHWLLGSGFGSFGTLYELYEPADLLMVAYVNHAHNDWLQLVIEGGIPGVLILAGVLLWAARGVAALPSDELTDDRAMRQFFWIAVFIVIGAASFVDYPLRTPIYQVVGVWLLVCLALDQRAAGSRNC